MTDVDHPARGLRRFLSKEGLGMPGLAGIGEKVVGPAWRRQGEGAFRLLGLRLALVG